jgi:hypothetical protein
MKIDKKKLVELLIEKTGMEKEAVESQLDELISRIQDAAKKGKALEIKGFGLFYFSKQGELKFDPSEELKTEVNHKYTGMDPVEIKKPRESTDVPAEEASADSEKVKTSAKSESIWDFDEEAEADETPTGSKKKIDKESTETDKSRKSKASEEEKGDVEDRDIFAQFDHGSIAVPGKKSKKEEQSNQKKEEKSKTEKKSDEPVVKGAEKKTDETKHLKRDPLEKQKKKTVHTDPKPATKGIKPSEKPKTIKKTPPKSTERKQNNPVYTIMAVIVVLLVIIVGIIVAFDLTGSDTATDQQEAQADITQMEPQPQAPADIESEMNGLDEMEIPDEESEDLTETPEQDDQEQVEQPAIEDVEVAEAAEFGLYGSVITIEDRHYSIILHSIRSEAIASGLRDELQDEGYRAVIYPVDHEEFGTMWRVGIGQFLTIADAQNAATELPQNYQDNHFIGLIQ